MNHVERVEGQADTDAGEGADSLDATDRRLINELQGGFPLCERPYAQLAADFGIGEDALIARLQRLLDSGVLSRFGPLYNAEQFGGALTLAALAVPPADFERVAEQVNSYPEVAHNYAREHELNMWFVVHTDSAERLRAVLRDIEGETGLPVVNMPKEREFFVGLHLEV